MCWESEGSSHFPTDGETAAALCQSFLPWCHGGDFHFGRVWLAPPPFTEWRVLGQEGGKSWDLRCGKDTGHVGPREALSHLPIYLPAVGRALSEPVEVWEEWGVFTVQVLLMQENVLVPPRKDSSRAFSAQVLAQLTLSRSLQGVSFTLWCTCGPPATRNREGGWHPRTGAGLGVWFHIVTEKLFFFPSNYGNFVNLCVRVISLDTTPVSRQIPNLNCGHRNWSRRV